MTVSNLLVVKEKALTIIDIGRSDYMDAYYIQKDMVEKRKLDIVSDALILTEHNPVFTVGRTGSKKNLLVGDRYLKKRRLELIETDRGGDITFHGPGQLLLYPILNLKNQRKDVHLYIRKLEKVMIDFLYGYDISGKPIAGKTGVWIDNTQKIGSIGVAFSKWITYHGLSININTPLSYFKMIKPCGLNLCDVVSISSVLKKEVDINTAKKHLVASFKRIFKYE